MKQLIAHCVLVIYLSAAPLYASGRPSSRDMHVWRGEFEHALSAEGGELDRAAYLTLAGEAETALDALEGSADSLRLGILSFRAGRPEEALLLLGEPRANVHLETYRIFYRASSLDGLGRHEEAARMLAALIRTGSSAVLGDRPRDLFVETSYRAGAEPDSISALLGGLDRLHGTAALMLSDLLFEDGKMEEAGRVFLKGIEAVSDTASGRLFGRLFDRFLERLGGFDEAELADLAEACLSLGESSKASAVIEHMESAFPGSYRVQFLKGSLLVSEKKRKRALAIFDGIFDSDAPVELKKAALLECASIEYGRGRYEHSAERYRLFGLFYPDDRRSSYALDVAARIYVARRMFDRALDTWERLRARGAGDAISREAAISEAALRHARGDSQTAYSTLRDLLAGGTRRDEPAVLYWLHETSGAEAERDAWKRRLLDGHPGSFYSIAAENAGMTFTIGGDGPLDGADRLVERLELREREFVASVEAALRPDERLYGDEAYEALVYFLERGFTEEARSCAGLLERLYGSDAGAMAALYATVRYSGLVDVGLKLLWTKGLSGEDLSLIHI